MTGYTTDADAILAEVGPPRFKLAGRVYRGRMLSFAEWRRFEPMIVALGKGELSDFEARVFLRMYVSALFPRGWKFWTRRFWQRSVASAVLRLPRHAQERVMRDFFTLQALANGAIPSGPSPTSGNGSPPPDAEPPQG